MSERPVPQRGVLKPAIRVLLDDATAQLDTAGVGSPRVDAELLLSHVLNVPRSQLLCAPDPTDQEFGTFRTLLKRRVAREPLQHLTGEAYFRYLTLCVGPGVFIPRPETETLVDLALVELAEARARNSAGPLTVVDLCTGSGAIPLAIATESRGTRVLAVEYSHDAFEWAQQNVATHGAAVAVAGSTLELIEGDAQVATSLLSHLIGQVDVLTCNPPYIPNGAIPRDPEVRDFDPGLALYGGRDGLDIVRAVVDEAATLLRPGGLLLIEHGDEQGEAGGPLGVPAVVRASSRFGHVVDNPDLGGRPRVTSARRS